MNTDWESRTLHWDGTLLLQAFHAAEGWLKQHVPTINAMNVFPVPDGDTGTNMHMTLASAIKEVVPVDSCAVVSEHVYHGALMAARGNSGVILSQILRGLAQGLADQPICGPGELAHALVHAGTTAYNGASEPREGTMLTVIRETGDAAQAALAQGAKDMLTVLSAAVEGARASVERTPSLLAILREAGVVDAGGQGVYIILEGMLRWVRGELVSLGQSAPDEQGFTLAFQDIHTEDDFGYCTNVLLQGAKLPFDEIRSQIDALGTSVVVVGDEQLVRIHVHTPRPGDILNYAVQHGDLLQIEITNMDQQRRKIQHRTDEQTQTVIASVNGTVPSAQKVRYLNTAEGASLVGVVAVAPGQGFADIFQSLHVGAVVMGGQTMNPSTQDLVEAIEALPQHEVIVLPNNGNIIMAAQQAATVTHKNIRVLPSKTVPQGIAALVGFGYQRNLTDNVALMQRSMEHVTTAEITVAVRNTMLAGTQVYANQTIALLDGELVAAGDDRDVVMSSVLDRMHLESHEILTIYYGQDVSPEDAQTLAAQISDRMPNLEVEVCAGGQPLYDYIFAAE